MAWQDGLPPETIRKFRDRHPTLTLEQIATRAMKLPAWEEEFAQLGARVEEYEEYGGDNSAWPGFYAPEDFPSLHVPEGAERRFANLVVAAMLADESRRRRKISSLVSPTTGLTTRPRASSTRAGR